MKNSITQNTLDSILTPNECARMVLEDPSNFKLVKPLSTTHYVAVLNALTNFICSNTLTDSNRNYIDDLCKCIAKLLAKKRIFHTEKKHTMVRLCESNPDAVKLIIQHNAFALQNIKRKFRTEELHELAIETNAFAIQFIHHPSESLSEKAIKKDAFAIQFVKNKTQELCDLAYQVNPDSIQFFNNTVA